MADAEKLEVKSCPGQFGHHDVRPLHLGHLRSRLAQRKIAPLVQFMVYTFNCPEKTHESPEEFHVDFVSVGSNVAVPGGLQQSIAAVEVLLAALKAKLQ